VLDFGGDKTPPFLRGSEGRGIELLLEDPDALEAQLRAVLAVAGRADLRILLPMVETVRQVDLSRRALLRAVASLAFGDPGTAIGDAGPADRDAKAAEVPDHVLEAVLDRVREGVTVAAAAFTEDGMVASGQHQPVGATTEIVGVGTLPSMRRRGLAAAVTSILAEHAFANGVDLILLSAESKAVAAVYERVGFHRIATAGAAE